MRPGGRTIEMSRWIAGFCAMAAVLWAQAPFAFDDAEAREAARQFEAVRPDPPPAPILQSATRSLGLPASSGKVDPRITALIGGSGRSLNQNVPVRAIIEAQTSTAVPAIRRRLEEAGSAATSSFENVLYATVPASSAPAIAEWQGVRSVRIQDEFLPAQARPAPNPPTAEVQRIGLEALQKQSLTGKGVRIGILDHGFAGLDALIASGRARRPAAQQAFPMSHGLQNQARHGTACAEIIAGIAPGAELYLASFDGYEGSLMAAAEWLISKGVRIISYSGGNPSAPSDGSDPLSRLIDRSTKERQVLWVVSSGNTGDRHWSSLSADANGDGWIDVNGHQPYLTIIPMEPKVSVTVRWNDWGADPRRPMAAQDIDVQLVELTGQKLRVVADGRLRQEGTASRPVEWLRLDGKEWLGRKLALMLQPVRVKREVLVHVFVESKAQMVPVAAERSVLSPSAAQMAVSVGGFDVVQGKLALYSAQGPTDDNRLKPELVAPTNVPSRTYLAEGGRFEGTSASSPHASGLAALLLERFQPRTAMHLRTMLLQASAPLGKPPHPNSLYGYGRLDASRARPAVSAPTNSRGLGIGTVTLPAHFGGEVSFAQLDRWREAVMQQDLFTSRVSTDRTLYQFGDTIEVFFDANAAATCALLYRDNAGTYAAVVPRVEIDPAAGRGSVRFKAAEPAGQEEFILVCASEPVDLNTINPEDARPEIAVSRAIFDVVPPFL